MARALAGFLTRVARPLGATLVFAALAAPGSAATFNYLPSPVDVTPGVAGAWTDVDVSAYVPAGATGVIIQWDNLATGNDEDFGIRKKGSTDGFFTESAKDDQQGWLMTGLDTSRVFQVYLQALGPKTYLVGYTMAGVTFLTNRVDKSTATTGTYQDVSIAADTGAATAIGAIFVVYPSGGSGFNYAVRKKGSTDDRFTLSRATVANVVMVGVDSAETAQQRIGDTSMDLYLVGYVTSGAVFFTNALDKSTATTGSYVPVDMTADLGAGVANGVFLEISDTGGNDRLTAVRPGGASYDLYSDTRHQWAVSGLDAGDVFEQKIENAQHDLYVVGYSLADGTPAFRVKSGSYVGTGAPLSIAGLGFQPDVVIVDSDGGGADAVIRTSTMSGLDSKHLDNGAAFGTTRITSLDPDGFGVGTSGDVNTLGVTYYWVAFRAAPGVMKVGTYPGVAGSQSIAGIGFTPAFALVMSPNAQLPVHRYDLMPANLSLSFESTGYTNAILNMQANGFGLGNNASVAQAATTFHYVAWNRAPGQVSLGLYPGDGNDDRDITGSGFMPEYAIVSRSSNAAGSQGNPPTHKPASTGPGTDGSLIFDGNALEADNIQRLQPDGFQVGQHQRVNSTSGATNYYWITFGPHTPKTFFRSAGTNGANLNVSGRTVAISGNTATFSGAMPANVGVGDVLQYQVTGTFYLAFVSGRTSSTVYTVVSASGGPPQAAAGGTAVSVYRAYTLLSRWQALDENDSLDDTVENFDTSRDLVAADAVMLVACYNDGPMSDMVNVDLWTTGPANYIRIFTPVAGHQVGASQRHTGVAGTGFRLTPVASGAGYDIVNLNTGYVRVEGLEIDGSGVTNTLYVRGIRVQNLLSNVGDIRIDANVIHDLHTTQNGHAPEGSMGILDFQSNSTSGPPMLVTNNVIYDITNVVNLGHIGGIHIGSRATSYVYNNTVYGIINTGSACAPDCGPAWGIYAKAFGGGVVNVIASNNYAGNIFAVSGTQIQRSYDVQSGATMTQSYNVSSDATAAGTGSQVNRNVYASYFQSTAPGAENLHLLGTSAALWTAPGTDLSATFRHDVDGQLRTAPWDVGADETNGTTAVTLQSFEAAPGSGEVLLSWRTASELSNLGFHLYRGPSAGGPWSRLTASMIPGLGSSPIGKAYAYRDAGLQNGTLYFYRLDDVDASGLVTSHGPVSAAPAPAAAPEADPRRRDRKRQANAGEACPAWVLAAYAADAEAALTPRCTRHGDPEAASFRVLARDARQASVELRTPGFYALHEPDGSVRVFVPGFDFPQDEQAAALPLRRVMVDAVVGRRVNLGGVRAADVAAFPGLVPNAVGAAEMQAAWDGTVRAGRRAARGAARRFAAAELARLLPSVFQGEAKSAVVELSPLRYDASRRQIVLARTLRARLVFTGRETGERGSGNRGRGRAPRQAAAGQVVARLHAAGRGLHAVAFEQLFPAERRAVKTAELRLQLQGAAVAFHVEPDAASFGPGGRLYFFASQPPASTAFSPEVAYELVRGADGLRMARTPGAPLGSRLAQAATATASFETNRYYQPGLLAAADPWLWEAVPGGASRAKPFSLVGVDLASANATRLELFLQGASDAGRGDDHHVSVSLNGSLVGEARFAGRLPYALALEAPAGLLREGSNELTLSNAGDTGVASLVFLDRFTVSYPRAASTAAGSFEASWAAAGAASVALDGALAAVVDLTGAPESGVPAWVTGVVFGPGGVSFGAEAERRYLVATAQGLLTPRVSPAAASSLRSPRNQADYVLVAPRAFLPAAAALVERRRGQGLAALAVAAEDVYDEFGHGQPSAEAIRAFLAFAFHSWTQPSPRYVVLLGDASYDPRNFTGSSLPAPLPALFTPTSYLLTASDPLLAAVNGEDALPDLAIGRLPAATVDEARQLVDKLVAWEESAQGLGGPATLVADNPDLGGDFEASIADVAASFLHDRPTEQLRLRELGAEARPRILDSLNRGVSLLDYVGHGGAAVWASENVWNSWDAPSLQSQSRQPLLLTWNCLNGYFVAPTFDSLAESLVKPEGRGAIAAISPSGLSLNAEAHAYHRAFMAELTSGRHARLGDVLLAAQAAYARTGLMPELLSIYHLFGDPAMALEP